MRKIGLSAVMSVIAVVACSVQPPAGSPAPKIVTDEIAAYRRSQPAAPEPPTLESFGFVEGDAVTLLLNPSLAAAQVREQCDQKPVQRVLTPPRRQRYCRQTTIMGCGEYDTIPGEDQPLCEKTWILNPNACVRRANPNLPTISYRYERDCYKTPARAQVAGQIDIYAASTRATSDLVPNARWRLLGSASLSSATPSQTIRLADAPRPGECLVLADRDRRILAIRQGSTGSSQFFSTPQMDAARALAALQATAAQEQRAVAKLRGQMEQTEQAILANAAWRDNRCVVPAMAQLPPEPQGILPTAQLTEDARGFCALLLMSQFDNSDRVLEAALAKQEFEYVEDFKRFKSNLKAASCARGKYAYPSDRITRLRGGIEPGSAAFRNGAGFMESITAIIEAATLPKQDQQTEIVALLNECTARSVDACEAPRRDWQAEIERIRTEPQRLATQCLSDVDRIAAASLQLQQAEQRYAAAKALADAAQLSVVSGRIALSDALCDLN